MGVVILDIGDTVAGRYRITRPIVSGGMGLVYEVLRLSDAIVFALKVLHGCNESLSFVRFACEAQIAAQISHLNVVAIVDMDVDAEDYVFLVMEFVRGTLLSELRDRYGELAFARLVLWQIVEGLAVIHDLGIVHRDLKLANVFIVDLDMVFCAKITDFGVAMLRDCGDDLFIVDDCDDWIAVVSLNACFSFVSLMHTGVVVGTLMYMVFELFGGACHAKLVADIFGLGVFVFLLIMGEHLFFE